MNDQQNAGLVAKVRSLLVNNSDLLRNAGSLAATTGLTSLFGFVFWIIAAREYSKTSDGYGAAATNAIQVLSTIGMFGLGTMLIGELPKQRNRGGLFAAALIVSAVGSLILGLGWALIVFLFHLNMPGIAGKPARVLLFAVGTMLTGVALVFDEGTIGLLRGGVQLWRNFSMSLFKLLLLPVAALLIVHDEFGVGISAAFVAATALSMVPSAFQLLRSGSRVFHKPDWMLLRSLLRTALAHNWLNLCLAVPPLLIPEIVTLVVSPAKNAVFYNAYMINSFLFMVPVHLSTVLFAIASASPELIAEKLRFVLRLSLMIGLPVMIILAISAHFALSLFGPGYAAQGTVPLLLMMVGYIPQMPKAQYIAVSRATNKVGRAALLLCCTEGCELTAIAVGGHYWGLDGVCLAYLSALTCEGLLTAPTVLRAAYTRTKSATGAFPAVPAAAAVPTPTGPLARVTGELIRLTGALSDMAGGDTPKESSLATLVGIATAALSDTQNYDAATEVWKTGGFPVIPGGMTGPRPRPNAQTTLDLLGGQSADGLPLQRLSYRYRQQAGVDALLALATPAEPQPAELEPTELEPAELKPAEPEPAEPEPAEPEPTELVPAELEPAEPQEAAGEDATS